jgi:hypothetical protein
LNTTQRAAKRAQKITARARIRSEGCSSECARLRRARSVQGNECAGQGVCRSRSVECGVQGLWKGRWRTNTIAWTPQVDLYKVGTTVTHRRPPACPPRAPRAHPHEALPRPSSISPRPRPCPAPRPLCPQLWRQRRGDRAGPACGQRCCRRSRRRNRGR